MSAMSQWECLLGLPLDAALERTRAAGVTPAVLRTAAPARRGQQEDASLRPTERVIRVCEDADGLRLTVSAFMDGDPRREK